MTVETTDKTVKSKKETKTNMEDQLKQKDKIIEDLRERIAQIERKYNSARSRLASYSSL